MERRNHLGLLAVEARGEAALRQPKGEVSGPDIDSVEAGIALFTIGQITP